MERIRIDCRVNKDKEILLALLQAGMWERCPDDISLFRTSDASWSNVFRMARCQTVTGIVYHGLSFLPEELLPPENLLLQWVTAVDGIERKNRKMNHVLAELYAFFRANGLEPVLQKGQGVAALYETPMLRECGDIDFYFPDKNDRKRAIKLVKEHHCVVKSKADDSVCYKWKGVHVEHHGQLLDLSSPFTQKYLKKLEREAGFDKMSLSLDGSDIEVSIPSPMLNLLLLNTHILKHAFGLGIGLRQLCDMARACYKLEGKFDVDEMKKICNKVGLGKWSMLLNAALVSHVGLSPRDLPYPDIALSTRPLLDIIWNGGNFGQYASDRAGQSQTIFSRKIYTSQSFLRNVKFSCRYAPAEAFWTFMTLLKGQFR